MSSVPDRAGAAAEIVYVTAYLNDPAVHRRIRMQHGSLGSVEIGWSRARAVTRHATEPYASGSGYRKIDSLRDNLAAVLGALASGVAPPVTRRQCRRGRCRDRRGVRLRRRGWPRPCRGGRMTPTMPFVHSTALIEDDVVIGEDRHGRRTGRGM